MSPPMIRLTHADKTAIAKACTCDPAKPALLRCGASIMCCAAAMDAWRATPSVTAYFTTEDALRVRSRPFLCDDADVRAILDGSKTVARLPIKMPRGYESDGASTDGTFIFCSRPTGVTAERKLPNPFGSPGTRMWCKEAWRYAVDTKGRHAVSFRADGASFAVMASDGGDGDPVAIGKRVSVADMDQHAWRSPHRMPRWASRIFLDVVSVRIECLHAITEEGAKAEGMRSDGTYWDGGPHRVKGTPKAMASARAAFADLWNAKHGKHAPWDWSPMVWLVVFRRVRA